MTNLPSTNVQRKDWTVSNDTEVTEKTKIMVLSRADPYDHICTCTVSLSLTDEKTDEVDWRVRAAADETMGAVG